MTQLYKDWAPTSFDPKGLMLDDRQEWIVVPVMQTRDSGCLDESNFAAALEILGGESETVEVHRFGHWGPGWFEIIIVSPERADEVDEIEGALENYPVLDDEDFSRREWEKASDYWVSLGASHSGLRERVEICQRFRASVFAARRDEIPERVDIGYLAE